jgi:hypothetical protein
MGFDEELEQALGSAEPVSELRALAARLIAQGREREAVLQLFEAARGRLRKADREKDEDAVLDVMDFLVGWCSPHMEIPLSEASNGARAIPDPAPRAGETS